MATILVVDDDVAIRALINATLSSNYAVIEASNGQEALQLFDAYHPNLVITDYELPAMDGLELVRTMRALNAKVKIIAASRLFNYEEDCRLMLQAGADLCVPKPIDLTTLEKSVVFLLKH